jgi:hypothetical protein
MLPLAAFLISAQVSRPDIAEVPAVGAVTDADCVEDCSSELNLFPTGCQCVSLTAIITENTPGVCNSICDELLPCSISGSFDFYIGAPCSIEHCVKVRETPSDPWTTSATLTGSNVNPKCGKLTPLGEVGFFENCGSTPTCTFTFSVGCYYCSDIALPGD